jgi:pimeloyl-ACP methyl ester carboxylesterase
VATIAVNGTTFGYDEAGEGPAVVLLHAALGDRRMWDAPGKVAIPRPGRHERLVHDAGRAERVVH